MKTPLAGFDIRPAAEQDMPACASILNEWIDNTEWMPRVHPADDVQRHFREFVFHKRQVIVASHEKDIAGYVALSDDHYVTSLYAHTDYRNRGVGKALINVAKTEHPEGLQLWTFKKNVDAQRFYEREGFQVIDESDGDNEEKLPDLLYSWQPEGEMS